MTKQECEKLNNDYKHLIGKVGTHKSSGDRIRISLFRLIEKSDDYTLQCVFTHEKSNTGEPLSDDILIIINTYKFH